jgi:type IV pilus assembly protein PilQ
MNWLLQRRTPVNRSPAPLAAERLAVALALLLSWSLAAGRTVAEDSAVERLFEGVKQGAATPELLRNVFSPYAQGSESIADQSSQQQEPANGGSPRHGQGRLVQSPLDGQQSPPPAVEGTLPLSGWNAQGDVQISQTANGLLSLVVRDASLSRVLALLAQTQGLNIVASNDIDAMISITLHDVPIEEALTAILSVANYTWVRQNNIILVTALSGASNLPAAVQGRQIEVFDLDFASGDEVAKAVEGFLSPIGKAYVITGQPDDNRRTRESVVVEDLPESLARIASYIQQIDQPPRQVLIEAHILQISLEDTNKQGVNFDALMRIAGERLHLKTVGFASATASPAFIATLDGGDLQLVIEMIETSTDAKNLGSPKVLVLNEQEAKIHVGKSIGYQGSQTTTETSTFQSAQFIEVGVLLNITPRITRDGRVLLTVKPEVSDGAINPITLLPDTTATELETEVMLNDGEGMIIGGLIKENDTVKQNKVPVLGDVRGIGWFFRRSEVTKTREEIIIALVPRIQPYDPEYHDFEQGELVKAGVPLLKGPLCRTCRPWDAVLPDGRRVAIPLVPRPRLNYEARQHAAPMPQYYVPSTPLPKQHLGDEWDQTCDPTGPLPSDAPLLMPGQQVPTTSSDQWMDMEIISDQN